MDPDIIAELFVLLDRKAQLLYDIGKREAMIQHLRLHDSLERAHADLANLQAKLAQTNADIDLGLHKLREGA